MNAIGEDTHTLIPNNSHHIIANVNLIDPHSKFEIPDKIPTLKVDVVRQFSYYIVVTMQKQNHQSLFLSLSGDLQSEMRISLVGLFAMFVGD